MNAKMRESLKDFLVITVATAIVSCAVFFFLEPSHIAVGKVAPLAFHVHAKDFLVKPGTMRDPGAGWFRSRGGTYLRGTIIGNGEVPVEQDLWILKNAGYSGYVTVEFEGSERCPDAIVIGAENLKRYIANL